MTHQFFVIFLQIAKIVPLPGLLLIPVETNVYKDFLFVETMATLNPLILQRKRLQVFAAGLE
jgi:hypothetical protein